MIEPNAFLGLLRQSGISTFTGVPCSYLKALITELSGESRYIAAASEGEAIGIAAGSHLAGAPSAVLIQSSGLGNCINPLTSLVVPFEIPVLLVVGYRNAEGKGPPQHAMMGEITESLLELMGIRHATLEPSLSAAGEQLSELMAHSRSTNRAVALLVRDKTFAPAQPPIPAALPPRYPFEQLPCDSSSAVREPRIHALRAILNAVAPEDIVVTTTGMTSRELFTLEDRSTNFYMVGSMGCAAGLGLGLARAAPNRRVVVVDGDGALLMKLGSLATIGYYQPTNLVHVVLDNGTYESTGSQPTTATVTQFTELARASGYRTCFQAKAPSDLTTLLHSTQPSGPCFVHLAIADGHLEGVGRVPSDLAGLASRLRHALDEGHVHSAIG